MTFFIKTTNVDPDIIINEVDDANLKDELRSRQHLFVDSEFEQGRHKVLKYAIESLNVKIVDENLDHLFSSIKSGAIMNSFWIHFKNYGRGWSQKFSRTRKQYPAGSIRTCVHQGRPGKAKGYSEQNLTSWILVVEKKGTQSGRTTNGQTQQFWLLYSKAYK